MSASGVIGPKQSYTATAQCGVEQTIDSGTKLTWSGFESSSTNIDISLSVVGHASWDRKTGMATEELKISGDAAGKRVAKGICNQDPFLKDPPGGGGACNGIQTQYNSEAGPIYEFFTSPRFFLARTISLVEAQALSQGQPAANPAPPPPPAPPVTKHMSSPSGARFWEGEGLFASKKTALVGGGLSAQPMQGFGAGWSGDAQLLWKGGAVGAVLDLFVDVKAAGVYDVTLAMTQGPDYGIFQAEVDHKKSSVQIDLYSPRVMRADRVHLGAFRMDPGPRTVSLMIIGKNPQSHGYVVGVDSVTLTPEKNP